MNKQKVIKDYEGLFQKVEQIKQSYGLALNKAKEEKEKLIKSIREGEADLNKLYKSYVLEEVTLAAYQQEQKTLQDKKDILHVVEEKLKDIDQLMKEELRTILTKIKELTPEYVKADASRKAKELQTLQEAKSQYLAAIHQAQLNIKETAKYSVLAGQLEVDAGLKQFNYASRGGENQALLSRAFDGYKGVDVSGDEVRKAYWYGV
jgi:Na+-transporting NADH:ubiquinone oxidoreductase subunit NqrC